MTNAEKARDLAEKVMGWKIGDPASLGVPAWFRNGLCMATYFWDPFTSRDDLAELLGKVADDRRYQVAVFLESIVMDTVPDGAPPCGHSRLSMIMWNTLTATPAQVSEAVWRATCQ